MRKPKLFNGIDVLRIARKITIDDQEDFAFYVMSFFVLQFKIDEYFSIAYSALINDPTIKKVPSYHYGLRIMLAGNTPRLKNWRKKHPSEIDALWKWEEASVFAEILGDMKQMLDIFGSVDLR